MTKIVVSAETESWTIREANPTDQWDTGDTDGRVTDVVAYVESRAGGTYYGSSACVDLDVKVGGTVYAVVADYSSGSTFGQDGGYAQVLDAFTTEAEAEALLAAAKEPSTGQGFDRMSFEHGGKRYARIWDGYFESLNSLTVWEVQVRLHPADPFRKRKGTGRYSDKRAR